MNVFVTVGTTPFDSLIKYIDQSKIDGISVVMQIATGKYIPQNAEFFSFTEKIDKYYDEADIIITHAGAGSVYKLLEKSKKIIVFPNIDRIDRHQLEIANFIYTKNLGLIGSTSKILKEQIFKVNESIYSVYKKDDFFAGKYLRKFLINNHMKC